MTDARLRSEWLNSMKFDGLSDTAWRVFTSALMWSNGNSTDGIVPTRYLRMLHPDGNQWDACNEIERAGLWIKTEDGYVLDDWDGALGQSTAVQVETYKANARERQRKHREKERVRLAKTVGFAVTRDETSDVTSPVTHDVGEGTGEGTGAGEGAGITKVQDSENDDDGYMTVWDETKDPVPAVAAEAMSKWKHLSPGDAA